jgi:hypothetical protein
LISEDTKEADIGDSLLDDDINIELLLGDTGESDKIGLGVSKEPTALL